MIDRNEGWLRLKGKAQRTRQDERYVPLRKQGSVEVEPVFGQLNGNQGFRRFLLRGRANVSTEGGLLALGYQVKQMHRKNNQKPALKGSTIPKIPNIQKTFKTTTGTTIRAAGNGTF